MNLTNLLDYSNSIYNFNGEINSVERKNTNAITKPSTALKMLICGIFTKAGSINMIEKGVFDSNNNRFKNIFSRKEFIPKTHALRDCIDDIKYTDIKNIHNNILTKLIENKFFTNHNYRGLNVTLVDGLEAFETHKDIEGLHKREHKDGTDGYYYKALGIMYLTEDVDIMIDMVPFEKYDVKEDKEHNNKVKSEGEITVFKNTLKTLLKYQTDICVLDCMFLNAPCFNEAKKNDIDLIVKLTDTRRDLYKDASKLFKKKKSKEEYEIVEITEIKKVKYSKESKKKNTTKIEKYIQTRKTTDVELNELKVVEEKETKFPKKVIHLKRTEKVIKRVKVWADNFEMTNYSYGLVKVIKVEEETKKKGKKETNEMYIVTTLLEEDLEFIIDLMHKRWDIELKGFRKLKTRYNIDHLYVGTDNAIRLIMYLTMIIYNLIELYFNIHTRKYKHSINFENLLEEYKIEISKTKDIYKYFLVHI